MYTSIMPIFLQCSLGASAGAVGAIQLSRLGRIMRLLRVLRVVKVIQKCFQRSNPDGEKKEEVQSAVGTRLNELIIMEVPSPALWPRWLLFDHIRVDGTSMRTIPSQVISMTLILMFMYPQFSFDETDESRNVVFPQVIRAQNYSTFSSQLDSYRSTGEANSFVSSCQ